MPSPHQTSFSSRLHWRRASDDREAPDRAPRGVSRKPAAALLLSLPRPPSVPEAPLPPLPIEVIEPALLPYLGFGYLLGLANDPCTPQPLRDQIARQEVYQIHRGYGALMAAVAETMRLRVEERQARDALRTLRSLRGDAPPASAAAKLVRAVTTKGRKANEVEDRIAEATEQCAVLQVQARAAADARQRIMDKPRLWWSLVDMHLERGFETPSANFLRAYAVHARGAPGRRKAEEQALVAAMRKVRFQQEREHVMATEICSTGMTTDHRLKLHLLQAAARTNVLEEIVERYY